MEKKIWTDTREKIFKKNEINYVAGLSVYIVHREAMLAAQVAWRTLSNVLQ